MWPGIALWSWEAVAGFKITNLEARLKKGGRGADVAYDVTGVFFHAFGGARATNIDVDCARSSLVSSS